MEYGPGFKVADEMNEAAVIKAMTIGQVSQFVGVGRDTIRFYEREGLIAEPARSAAGYRLYPPQTIARLRFIQQAKSLGFSLNEIRVLLSFSDRPNTDCAEIKRQADAKIADIDGKIANLQQMRKALIGLTSACPGQGPSTDCPILDALASEEQQCQSS